MIIVTLPLVKFPYPTEVDEVATISPALQAEEVSRSKVLVILTVFLVLSMVQDVSVGDGAPFAGSRQVTENAPAA